MLLLTDSNISVGSLLGEGGFAVLVETSYDDSSKYTMLFDTASGTPALLHNLRILEQDLSGIDTIILSHGHWDHVGGLMDVLNQIDKQVPVYCHPDALVPKVFVDDDKRRDVGYQGYFSVADLRSKTEVITTKEVYELAPGIKMTGEVPRINDFEKITGRLKDMVRVENGDEFPDQLIDDISVSFELSDGSVGVLAGCCHSGIVNTCKHVADYTGTRDIIGIVGGLHLHDASKERLTATVDHLKSYPLMMLAPCHCTGLNGRCALKHSFEAIFKDVGVGSKVAFEPK